MDTDQQSRAKIVVLLLVCLVFSIGFSYILTRQPSVLIRSDHFSRWYATHKLVTESRSLYDPANGREIVSLNTIPTDPIEGSFFYPAHLILVLLPLAWLPYPLAHFIWLVSIQLFYISGIFLILKVENWPSSPNYIAIFLLLSVFFIPNLQNTIWGQFNTISVISLAIVYLCIRCHLYLAAGIFALGLTLKPQTMLLTLGFLILYAIFDRRRWPFLLGLGAATLVALALVEFLEPNWISSFLEGVRAYEEFHHPMSLTSWTGTDGAILNGILILLVLLIAVWNRRFPPDSASFAGGLVLSLSVWWLTVGVLGMMNMVALPLSLIWLFANLEKFRPALYRFSLIFYLALYLLGLAGFIYGLTSPELYGLHTQLSEFAYKIVAPIMTAVLAIPLCFADWPFPSINLFRRKEAL